MSTTTITPTKSPIPGPHAGDSHAAGKPGPSSLEQPRIWFVHYTSTRTVLTKERVRKSLGTRSLEEARRLRDRLFEKLSNGIWPQQGCATC